jgi:hypothetical protein
MLVKLKGKTSVSNFFRNRSLAVPDSHGEGTRTAMVLPESKYLLNDYDSND